MRKYRALAAASIFLSLISLSKRGNKSEAAMGSLWSPSACTGLRCRDGNQHLRNAGFVLAGSKPEGDIELRDVSGARHQAIEIVDDAVVIHQQQIGFARRRDLYLPTIGSRSASSYFTRERSGGFAVPRPRVPSNCVNRALLWPDQPYLDLRLDPELRLISLSSPLKASTLSPKPSISDLCRRSISGLHRSNCHRYSFLASRSVQPRCRQLYRVSSTGIIVSVRVEVSSRLIA